MPKYRLPIKSALYLSVLSVLSATASVIRDDVPYETFRDFAENKGAF